MRTGRNAAEDDLELVHREEQQKMNELHVVVPLSLKQVKVKKLLMIKLSEDRLNLRSPQYNCHI